MQILSDPPPSTPKTSESLVALKAKAATMLSNALYAEHTAKQALLQARARIALAESLLARYSEMSEHESSRSLKCRILSKQA